MKAIRVAARLRRMSGEELAFRLRVAVRAETGRLAAACRAPRWRVSDLARRLDPAEPLVRQAAERLEANDGGEAHVLLRRHFASRHSRFPASPSALALVRDRLLAERPGLAAEALSEVERLRRGRFDLLGYRDLDFATAVSSGPAPIDWHVDPVHQRRSHPAWWSRVRFLDPAHGDHKIVWELNRHQHFLRLARAAWLTNDPACRHTFEAHLRSWLAQNPPGIGINWSSMLELGLRSLSWVWALHLFASLPPNPRDANAESGPEAWIPDILLALDVQLEQVRRNLSRYFSPNTHLTGEALALYVCGLALPELRAARRWVDEGRAVLTDQIGVQILPDGGHCERSTHYLRYTLDFYLMALAFARAAGDAGAEGIFEEASARLARATRSLSDDAGRLPRLGDDDGGRLWPMRDREPADVRDSLAVAAALLNRPDLAIGPPPEEVSWLLGSDLAVQHLAVAGPSRAARANDVAASPDPMGYFVVRPAPGDHLVIDAGPQGFLNGGHAHADALSLVYTVAGRPLAIDPGTFTYTVSPAWRDRLRSSPWHNTLTLDRRSQSLPAGPFHWQTTATARTQAWDAGEGYSFFEGVHDGYAPLVHRRRVVSLAPRCLVVLDTVFGGGGEHLAEVHWHIDAAWKARRDARGPVLFAHENGGRARLTACGAGIEIFTGDEATGLGWQSPVYGRLVPCTTVRLAAAGRLPLMVASVFLDGADVQVEQRHPAGGQTDPADDSLAVCLRTGDREEVLLFTGHPVLLPGEPDPSENGRPHPARGRRFDVGGATVRTSARFAWLTGHSRGLPSVRAAVGGEVQVTADGSREQGVPGAA